MNFTAVRESHLAYIPVAHIVDDPAFCFRQPADPMIADIRSSFLRHGQTHPVTLETLSDGKYRVLDGHRRYRAVAQIRAEGGAWEKLLAHALPVGLSPLDQFRVLRERNDGASSSFGLAERSRFFAALWRQGVGVAAIAAEYSFSVAEVEDHLELAEAPHQMRDSPAAYEVGLPDEWVMDGLSVWNEVQVVVIDLEHQLLFGLYRPPHGDMEQRLVVRLSVLREYHGNREVGRVVRAVLLARGASLPRALEEDPTQMG